MDKKLLKEFIPPLFQKAYRQLTNRYGWFGDYASWADAEKDAIGYDSDEILEKVKNALLKVKNGEAVYERDSVLFDKTEYAWPLLASLLWIALQNKGKLNIIDLGGSLGSTFFQNRKFLGALDRLNWNIVEQEKFVECGKKYFEDNELKFYFDLDSCLKEQQAHVILLSCVLPYVEKPYELLEEVLKKNFSYLILDRMPLIDGTRDRLTVQKVPPQIYHAIYPCWFFNEKKLLDFISVKYDLIEDFECLDVANIKSHYKGFLFKAKAL